MSGLQDRVLGLGEAEREALKGADEETGLLGQMADRVYRTLRREGLIDGRHLTPIGVAVREYLITRAAS